MSRKRKQPQLASSHTHDRRDATAGYHNAPVQVRAPDPTLFIQAHEADVTRGPKALAAAHSLEVTLHEENGRSRVYVGEGLIKWQGAGNSGGTGDEWEGSEILSLGRVRASEVDEYAIEDGDRIWMDRYDARLLLETLPFKPVATTTHTLATPSSPGGWSDLPSDTEDTFFFSPAEAEDFRRNKRRRLIDQGREERLRALRSMGEDDALVSEEWGGSDEEPDNAQRELMRRTAAHVLASPHPAQLELRILANHGADARFAFLRGRWARAWRLAKGHARLEREREKEVEREKVGIGGLAGYGDSDNDEEREEGRQDTGDVRTQDGGKPVSAPELASKTADVTNDDIKATRRARAKEWAEKRRLALAAASATAEPEA